MDTSETYQTYRTAMRDLHTRIVAACLDPGALMRSARLLGVAQGTTLVFGDIGEEYALMDFALHDYRTRDKNAIETYYETVGWTTEIEKEILEALLASYTSLFRVISISVKERLLLLSDVMRGGEDLNLTDVGFSSTAEAGLLLFARIVALHDLTITSGLAYVFPGELEDYLLRRSRQMSRTVASRRESIRRAVSFFQLNQINGVDVRYL